MKRIVTGFLAGISIGTGWAQDKSELAKNNPVAIISLVQGDVQIKHPDGDWQPAYWLTLLRPEDQIKMPDKGKILVDFFSDDHLEAVDQGTEAKVAFKSLTKIQGPGGVRREQARDRAVVEIPIPYMLERKLSSKDLAPASEPDAMDKENVYLNATVWPELFPPVWQWKRTNAPLYRLQLFNEWDEVIYETKTPQNRFKFPYNGPFQLAKNSQYLWQVLDPGDQILVRKYPFTLLTTLHARELEHAEKKFEAAQKAGKAQQNQYTDMFILYNNRKLIDRNLALLLQMSKKDPENPMIYRALARVYLAKGCPAHAQQALDKELQLNGVDPLGD
jgi:hypothetical protein